MGNAAADLAIDDHRIDQTAGILGHQKLLDSDVAGLDIDFNNGGVTGIGKGAGRIIGRALGDARRDLALEPMRLMIRGARQRRERDGAVGAGDPRRVFFEHDIIGRCFE